MFEEGNFKIIENTKKAQEDFGHNYGSKHFSITQEEIKALLNGKQLASTISDEEYSIFVSLKEENE